MSKFFKKFSSILRKGFSRVAAYSLFLLLTFGYIGRTDKYGVSSCVRTCQADDKFYRKLLHLHDPEAVKLPEIESCWCEILRDEDIHPGMLEGRLVFVTDSIKIPKEGRRLIGTRFMTQESDNVRKPEKIFGNELVATGLLVENPNNPEHPECVPICLHFSQGTDSFRELLPEDQIIQSYGGVPGQTGDDILRIHENFGNQPAVLVGDAWYMKTSLLQTIISEKNLVMITRARKDTVGYEYPEPKAPGKRGPQPKLGKKLKLRKYFDEDRTGWTETEISLYGKTRKLRYLSLDLPWNPKERLEIRFVLVEIRGGGDLRGSTRLILACTESSISPESVIRAYCHRMKIELSFREMNQHTGLSACHFWSREMPDCRSGSSAEELPDKHQKRLIARSLKRVETHLQIVALAEGITQILALALAEAGVREQDLIWKRTYSENSVSTWTVQNCISSKLSGFGWKNPEAELESFLEELSTTLDQLTEREKEPA